ncbi:MAG: hypothetical protein CMI95_00370 [Pelagibacteraceae bacterium]|nr:hypothetical protein [Pelagibacteraceae bacterium]
MGIIILFPISGIINKFNFDYTYIKDFFQNRYNLRLVYFTFYQAFLSASISCILAIIFSLSMFRRRKNFFTKIAISLSGYSFVLPTILIVFSVIGIFGINGLLNNIFNFYNLLNIKSIFGLKGILIAHILLNTPFATRIFYQNLNSIPKNFVDVAKSMNFNFYSNFINIEWPIIKQNIYSTFSIIFIICFLSFPIVMALGGGPKNSTLEVSIYESIFYELNFNKAIIISFVQIIICLIFLIFGFIKFKGSGYFNILTDDFDYIFENNKIIKFLDNGIIYTFSLIFFSPILFILVIFLKQIIELDLNFNEYIIHPLTNSIMLSNLTAILVTFNGLVLSQILILMRNDYLKQQFLFLLTSIILVVSPIIISLGYYINLGELRYFNGINFFIIILINFIFILPFSILIFFTKLKNIYIDFQDIKNSFNISNLSFFKIIFPLIKKEIYFIYAFSTALSFGDFTVISFFKNENFQTLPTLLYRLIISYRFEEASYVAGLILIISLFFYLIIDYKFYKFMPDKRI